MSKPPARAELSPNPSPHLFLGPHIPSSLPIQRARLRDYWELKKPSHAKTTLSLLTHNLESKFRVSLGLNAAARCKMHFLNLQEQGVPGPSKSIHCTIIYSYTKVNLRKTFFFFSFLKKLASQSDCPWILFHSKSLYLITLSWHQRWTPQNGTTSHTGHITTVCRLVLRNSTPHPSKKEKKRLRYICVHSPTFSSDLEPWRTFLSIHPSVWNKIYKHQKSKSKNYK